MARRKLTCSLNKDSIGMVIRYLELFSLNIPAKCREFVQKLGDVGVRTVNIEFGGTQADPDYDTSHTTTLQVTSLDGLAEGRLVVSGEQVVFIEFGAGIYYNGAAGSSPHPLGKRFGYLIGEYGKHYGRRRAWYYQDSVTGEWIKTHGVRAQMPVWKATQEMIAQIGSVAKEVFGNVG